MNKDHKEGHCPEKYASYLKNLNNHLRYGENRNRSGAVKVEQCARLHEVLHHRPHQQEY